MIKEIKAKYKKQLIYEYKGNPLIEALPDIDDKVQVIDKISSYPVFDNEEKKLPAHIRLHIIQRIFKYFQPLPMHLDLESRISRMLRQGYINRNPLSSEYKMSLNHGYKDIENGVINNEELFVTTAAGFSLIGVSGMGKTTALNRILNTIPQVIAHDKYNGFPMSLTQLTWLKVDCPFDGSLKALCLNFLLSVDNVLGTNYFERYNTARLSANTLLPIMNQVARSLNLGMLIIDEIQHLSLAKSGGAEKMLNYFVTLINTIGVPVVLVGTPKALGILQSEFRQARRGSGQGDMVWDRLKNDEQWILLLEGLWDYQWTNEKTELTTELSNIIYEESQGIIDIAIKLFVMAQVRAVSLGKKCITAAIIRNVAKENLKLVRPMLKALSSGDLRNITSYNDIMVLDIDNFINAEKSKVELNSKIEDFKRAKEEIKSKAKVDIKEEVFIKLLELGFKEIEIKKYIDEVIALGEKDVGKIVRVIIEMIVGPSNKEANNPKRKANKIFEDDDVRKVAAPNKENKKIYENLKKIGYIKNYKDIFQEVV
ncbi:ATP-binding protein [Clostridium sp. SHJSY1]|uniref:ATP-binding protein n=1 Tax=Clostridium sp. SHJSY1 TaxID=2942483 RepID=UPI002874563B|nr:ATP-binding protein [Clostridium sp. SHJSY1]MDS0527609.1 ATP-binding protein [Clostridium sp. SHJSY1]